ncbi:MAG: diguanylate cyclase [Candidatus Accumulibacter sp.]|jgi:diguanylate cyclase (GGDEF)-like protein|nr:diguanylate cyclase [Accumulibacter sp.]
MSDPNPLPRLLIVDESRMVRAALIRQIRETYDYRQEQDGESAWQILVLDHSIELVICSLSLPVGDGESLLTRVRSSRLGRLARMPILMLAGDNDEAIERARLHGASDFIQRGAGGAELLARIDSLLKLARARRRIEEDLEQQVQNPETGIFTRKYIELQVLQAMSHAVRHQSEASVMVMGFDDIGALRDEYGADVLKPLLRRFITVLSGKIRKEDSLGHYLGSQLAVVSPGTSSAACEVFGNRLREAIRAASIAVQGERLALTISIGISNSPADEVGSPSALIELAGARLKIAQQAGGDRVIIGGGAVAPARASIPTVERALVLLHKNRESEVVPYLAELAGRLLPLLKLMDRELDLDLPIDEISWKAKGEDEEKEEED